MKEIVILMLSVSLVSVFAGTASAMHSFWSSADSDDSQETVVDNQDEGCSLVPIVSDQPPEDEEHWPGCRD